ncbi:hypothetical protein [uncultured Clostridium sp.]|nr:hypothetical protein [uncultured Clostridium sp.]
MLKEKKTMKQLKEFSDKKLAEYNAKEMEADKQKVRVQERDR